MSRKHQIVSIVCSFLFCGVVLGALSSQAKRTRTFLPAPVLQEVASPEASFRVWRENNLHGRILVLIDRRLNADDEVRSEEYHPDEFSDRTSLDRCCAALRDDVRDAGREDFPCTADGLNSAVLKRLVLYPLFVQAQAPDPTGEITTLAGYIGYPDRIDLQLPPVYGKMLPRMNRLIIQQLHPGSCPTLPEYLITAKNYVAQSVRAGITRKVYHLISDNAWEEVSRVLGAHKDVRRAGAGYHLVIVEGVPVQIMPVRMMPELPEQAMVVVNTDSVNEGELALLPGLLRERLRPDVVTLSGRHAGEVLRTLEVSYAANR